MILQSLCAGKHAGSERQTASPLQKPGMGLQTITGPVVAARHHTDLKPPSPPTSTSHVQVLMMVGVRPVADSLGRVNKLEVIPLEELGRPRVDVVVNCSGVFRDLFVNQVGMRGGVAQLNIDGACGSVVQGRLNREGGLSKAGGSSDDLVLTCKCFTLLLTDSS